MRTNIVIDEQLMKQAQAASGAKTKRETVEQGLKALITLQKQREIRSLRGKLKWEGDLDAMRRDA
jgi:Arc/MetJ family transcription regulator